MVSDQPLRVLHLVPGDGGTTSYYDVIDDPQSTEARFLRLSWPRALRFDYDVLHIHWPERLFRGSSLVRRIVKPVALLALLTGLRVRGIPLVRTLHNVAPHEPGAGLERFLLRLIDRRTDVFIVLNDHTPVPGDQPVARIAHPHYRAPYGRHAVSEVVPGRLLYCGVIRPYKGVPELIDAFAAWGDPATSLRIVGQPSADMAGRIEAVAGQDAVSVRLGYVSDADLVAEMTAAELVVLPYRAMHNSGVLFAALSVGRPVLVPRNPVTTDLAAEIGDDWILTYDGGLSPDVLADALTAVRAARSAAPTLDARSSPAVHAEHVAVYRQALAAVRERRSGSRMP